MFSNVSTRISHPWSAASSPDRLTPRGEPRQSAVVVVPVSARPEGHGRTTVITTSPSGDNKRFVHSNLSRQRVANDARADGVLCRPRMPVWWLGAEERGREQPPGL